MGNFTMEYFFDPPEKVRLMFQAVIDFIGEKTDVNSLKVQDITGRAGIGKGTAYEYFSSKEELITLAILYDYSKKIEELKGILDQQDNFQDKMYGILDWLHENKSYHVTFMRMIQLSVGTEDVCEALHSRIPKDVFEGANAYLLENGDAILEQGYREGRFTETDKVKRRLAFVMMILSMILSQEFMPVPSNRFFEMEYSRVREYAYETLIKTLT